MERKSAAEISAEIKARKQADREEQRRRRGRVKAYEKDGEYVVVEFTRDNGERVIGEYKLMGWGKAPRAVLEHFHQAMANRRRNGLALLWRRVGNRTISTIHKMPNGWNAGLPSRRRNHRALSGQTNVAEAIVPAVEHEKKAAGWCVGQDAILRG